MASNLRFYPTNYLPLLNNINWVLTGGAYLDGSGNIVLPAGGKMQYEISSLINKNFRYFKVVVRATCDDFSDESNYNNDALVNIRCTYLDADAVTDSTDTISMNISTYSVSGGVYTSTKIVPSKGSPLCTCVFEIKNRCTSALTIKSASLFVSEDISSSQVTDLNNASLKSKTAITFGFGTNADGTVFRELKVFLRDYVNPVIFSPTYNGNILSGIYISTGESVGCFQYNADEEA